MRRRETQWAAFGYGGGWFSREDGERRFLLAVEDQTFNEKMIFEFEPEHALAVATMIADGFDADAKRALVQHLSGGLVIATAADLPSNGPKP